MNYDDLTAVIIECHTLPELRKAKTAVIHAANGWKIDSDEKRWLLAHIKEKSKTTPEQLSEEQQRQADIYHHTYMSERNDP